VKEELLYNACGNQDYNEVLKRSEKSVQELQVQSIVTTAVMQQCIACVYVLWIFRIYVSAHVLSNLQVKCECIYMFCYGNVQC
jgi:hypothetical protein